MLIELLYLLQNRKTTTAILKKKCIELKRKMPLTDNKYKLVIFLFLPNKKLPAVVDWIQSSDKTLFSLSCCNTSPNTFTFLSVFHSNFPQ